MPESTGKNSKSYTYRASGVDIDKTNSMLSNLKKVIGSTHDSNVIGDLSSFSGLFRLDASKYNDPVLTSSTDGVGTKLILAKETGDYTTVGQDLVAMSVNDLICCGAKPLFFLDYIACGKINTERISTVIRSIADACRSCSTALLGGETAEMPDMYEEDEIDLAGFAVGIVEREKLLTPDSVESGDLIIGLKSSGIHSNGFSLVRMVIESRGIDLDEVLKWTRGKSLGKVLLTPTRLYSPIISRILENERIELKGIANITGGGFYDNIKRIIPAGMDAVIQGGSWGTPHVFKFIQSMGNIPDKEMYKVFNMGIGMVLVISPGSLKALQQTFPKKSEQVVYLGKVKQGTGIVRIEGIEL